MEDLYEILQCIPTASRDELRRAYTRLVLEHHPDKRAQREAYSKSKPFALTSSNITSNTYHRTNPNKEAPVSNGQPSVEECCLCGTEVGEDKDPVGEGGGVFHPGKSSDSKNKDGDNHFVKIDMAWKILGDDDLRAEYDTKWQDRCLMQEHPIQDTVPFDDFDYEADEEVYTYPCRCGSEFLLTKFDIQLLYDYVCCATCSLTIKITYDNT